jgi:hypothetical protein
MAELVITATVTDPAGKTATASVTVDVLDPQHAAARFQWFRPSPGV